VLTCCTQPDEDWLPEAGNEVDPVLAPVDNESLETMGELPREVFCLGFASKESYFVRTGGTVLLRNLFNQGHTRKIGNAEHGLDLLKP
jgi:hypothetical protein